MEYTPQEVKNYAKEQMVSRTDLDPVIHEIRNGSFNPEVDTEDLVINYKSGDTVEERTSLMERAKSNWEKTKVERNSQTAVFIEEAWESFKEERENFMYQKPVFIRNQESLVADIKDETEMLFYNYLEEWQKSRDERLTKDKAEWDDLDKSYDRYRKMLKMAGDNKILEIDSPALFIYDGVTTASGTTWSSALLIEELSQEKGLNLSKADKVKILQRSYGPVVGQFSSMNKEIAIPVLSGLKKGRYIGFDTGCFDIVSGGKDEYKLTVNHNELMNIKDENGVPYLMKPASTETTWCPAKYSSGSEGDVIKEYFDWNVKLAEQNLFGSDLPN